MSANRVLEFYADWCAACTANAPVVESALAARPDIDLRLVDIDIDPLNAYVHDVRSIPALLFFKDDALVSRREGAVTPDDLAAELTLIYGAPPS